MLDDKKLLDIKSLDLKVTEIIPLSPTAKAIRFNLEGRPFPFVPGQFAMLELTMKESPTFKILEGKAAEQKRAFSISSSSNNQKHLEFTAKMSGELPFFSKYLVHELKMGDVVNIKGPYGKFVLDLKLGSNVFLIGAGSGIAPLISIYRYMAETYPNKRVHLLFSNKTEKEILWKDEIVSLSKSKVRTYEFTLTQEQNGIYNFGRINREMIEKNILDKEDTCFYLCGAPSFVEAAQNLLLEIGIAKEKIRKEVYD